MLIWYSGRMEKQLNLIQVSRIIPGQRTVCPCVDNFLFFILQSTSSVLEEFSVLNMINMNLGLM
jgi:hypothetical protein